ncbi:MAG: hypothetical protein KDJ27_12235 [Gammaproteobacteria bacterium]|nr:hypothetical protein [Gammaproteobacteria bacterium]
MQDELATKLQQLRPRAAAIHAALQNEIDRLAFTNPVPHLAPLDHAMPALARDPASGLDSLNLEWRDAHGHRIGGIVLHADGSFFAEYDVVRAHPLDTSLFIEAVSAWGRDETIKSEVRCLPMSS